MYVNRPQLQRSTQAGFTLVELLAVVIIIGVLASIAIPAYNHYTTQARTTEATTYLPQIRLRVEINRQETQTTLAAAPHPAYTTRLSQGGQEPWSTPSTPAPTDWQDLGFTPPTPGVYFQYFVNRPATATPNPKTDLTSASGEASCHGLIIGEYHYPPGSGSDWYTVCARGSFTGAAETSPSMVFGMSGSSTIQRVFVDLKR